MFKAKFDFGINSPCDGFIGITADTLYTDDRGYGFNVIKNSENLPLATIHNENDFCYISQSDIPLCFDVKVPKIGLYTVKVKIFGLEEDSRFILQTQSRRFVLNSKLQKGETLEYEFTVSVCDVHPKEAGLFVNRFLNILLLGNGVGLKSIEIEQTEGITIWLAGDSTVTDQGVNYPYKPQSTYCGWGQMLGQYLNTGIAVSNHAQSGLTTDSFREGGHYAVIEKNIKAGDYVLFQFAHNDQKVDILRPFGRYSENLRRYVNEVRAKGAYPILCSPINRILFEPDGTIRDLLSEYSLAVKTVAEMEKVPFIDLLDLTTRYFLAEGEQNALTYFWTDGTNYDRTHTNDFGGDLIAKFVAQGIFEKVSELLKYIKTDLTKVEFKEIDEKVLLAMKKSDKKKSLEFENKAGLVNKPTMDDINGLIEKDAIMFVVGSNIMTTKDGKFMPDEPVKIIEMLEYILKALRIETESYIKTAIDKELLMGIPICEDDINKNITREEMAALIVNSYNYKAPDKAIVGNIDHISDRAKISSWALDFVRAGNEILLVCPLEYDLYRPDFNATRKDVALSLKNLVMTN